MIIQINTDHNISGSEKFITSFQKLVNDSLERYSEHISRIEIHMSDENGDKDSKEDKRCLLEARIKIKGKQPIAVTGNGNTLEESLNDAIEKISASLVTTLGKMQNHR